MARLFKYLKIVWHVICLLVISYYVTQTKPLMVKRLIRFLADIKHILIWTNIHGIEEEGQKYFFKNQCHHTNCYFTRNRSLFNDIRYFDAIVFNLQDVSKGDDDLPLVRAENQKYIFAANDSADNYPICSPIYDHFFNWTWTYKSDSTICYKFISVYNIFDEELGSHFHWKQKMKPVDFAFQSQLVTKSKAAAIFLDKCKSRSRREEFINDLKLHLSKYNLTVDVFGKCGKECKRKNMAPCFWKLKKDYYFYLALEDSFAKDYITDIVLYAYNNNAVPIVYGGADYKSFLPPNSYLNAVELGPEDLAKTINKVMHNLDLYYDFFRWKNHYNIKESKILNACNLCQWLNNPAWLLNRVTYTKFRDWWNRRYVQHCGFFRKLSVL